MDRVTRASVVLLNLALAGSVVWIAVPGAALEERFVEGFGALAAVLAGYALWGSCVRRASAAWNLGMLVIAVNFGVWAFALNLLA